VHRRAARRAVPLPEETRAHTLSGKTEVEQDLEQTLFIPELPLVLSLSSILFHACHWSFARKFGIGPSHSAASSIYEPTFKP